MNLFFKIVLFLVLYCSSVQAQIGIGTASPNSNAILDLTSSKRALLLPRVANTAAIVTPVIGMIIYDLSSNCYKVFQKGAWTGCGLVDLPPIVSLDTSAGFTPASANTVAPYSGTTTSSYTGGNGSAYSSVSYASSGVTGLTMTLNAGVLATGSGTLTYSVSGTPSSIGTATFNITFLGKTGTKSIPVYTCGAFVASGVYKAFMCHNLGANELLDPNLPVQGIHGNYYQWGRVVIAANQSTPVGAVSGWITVPAADGSWLDASKTANDPCPTGYRVPTSSQWSGVINSSLNTVSRTGSWANDGNFTTAIFFGPNAVTKTLTFPAAGWRSDTSGALFYLGNNGNYWSSTQSSSLARFFNFVSSGVSVGTVPRTYGYPIRCIAE